VPVIEKRIAPRERLSADDVAFLRHEIGAEISTTDPPWQRANKLRSWLARRARVAFPGLTTRNPREAYEQMKKGQPVFSGTNLARGFVNWSIGDSDRGVKSVGTIEPERISEVVSDIVESQSGYLDIGFDVPSGGSFRVIDVIVTEAPRFAPTN
jgi:hypothetical protein